MREVMFILARDRKFLDKSRLLTRDCQRRIILVKSSWLLTNFLPRVFYYLLEATPTNSFPSLGKALHFLTDRRTLGFISSQENLIESYQLSVVISVIFLKLKSLRMAPSLLRSHFWMSGERCVTSKKRLWWRLDGMAPCVMWMFVKVLQLRREYTI